MKKTLLILTVLTILIPVFTSSTSAQGMMNWSNTSSTASSSVPLTIQDEAKGKQVWDQLQSKQINCNSLKADDYEMLGEFFMGQSIGNTERHAVVNQVMQNMMGQTGEEQMHISLGKRSSGCDTNASFPSGYGLPMMGWMMGGWGGFGLGWMFMIIFWILIILGVIALVRYLVGATRDSNKGRSLLDILKERYAKGEIDKKEFEQMKKDIT